MLHYGPICTLFFLIVYLYSEHQKRFKQVQTEQLWIVIQMPKSSLSLSLYFSPN